MGLIVLLIGIEINSVKNVADRDGWSGLPADENDRQSETTEPRQNLSEESASLPPLSSESIDDLKKQTQHY